MTSLRDKFREDVFSRDGHKCAVCHAPATTAHHILEKKLWEDGGYCIENEISLCNKCHLKAEACLISCEELRQAADMAGGAQAMGF